MSSLNKKSIKDINVNGKRVLMRCDFNVPLTEDGNISDTKRIDAALDSIKYLIDQGAKLILCSHLGRPKGEINPKFSMRPVADYLTKVLNREVKLASDVVGESAFTIAKNLQIGEVELLENVRFEPGETKNDPELAKKFADLAEIYVNDAFGSAHRAHASTTGVAKYIPAVCGFLMQKEIDVMGRAISNPKRPFVAILGGAKVSDKIGVLKNLVDKVDHLIIGGGMGYSFLHALGYNVGKSLCEETDTTQIATDIMTKAKEKNIGFTLPVDTVTTKEFSADADTVIVESDKIPIDSMGLDIGPKSREIFSGIIKDAATVIWNGPMGVFEWEKFSAGTMAVAKALAESDAVSIIGGGDSASAVEKLGFADRITHISTGGGASLEFLEGKELPGIAALNDK